MSRSGSENATSTTPSPSRLSPIPRVTRAQAKTFNGETELALPAGVKRIRKPTEKVTAYDPTADFTPSPPRKKRARPGKSAAEQSSPGKNARIKATAPAAKRPVKKAPHTKTAPPAQKASRSNQPGGDNTVPSVNPTGPPAPTAKAAINAPAMQRVHPSPAARVDSVDHRVDTNTADRTATNFFEHFPFGPVAPITPSRVIVDGLISASQKNQVSTFPVHNEFASKIVPVASFPSLTAVGSASASPQFCFAHGHPSASATRAFFTAHPSWLSCIKGWSVSNSQAS